MSALKPPTDPRENLLDLTPEAALVRLETFFEAVGQPRYRARQVVRHLWVAPVSGFEEMTALPKAAREKLSEAFIMPRLTIAARQASKDGTEKFLFKLRDNEAIETV